MRRVWICAELLSCILSAFGQSPDWQKRTSSYPEPNIREEQTVKINGEEEIWRIEWRGSVVPYCDAKDEGASTCPCVGFAYGESGDAYLTRFRDGKEFDRLHLTPFFRETNGAVLQRWPFDDKDFGKEGSDGFAATVTRRPTVPAMEMKDYNHDGQQTEFYLQTESAPCGKSVGLLVGVSKQNPMLHAFTSTTKPGEALYLQKREWNALRTTRSKRVNIVDWQCFDHASEWQDELTLQWSGDQVEGVRRSYGCTEKGRTQNLMRSEPL